MRTIAVKNTHYNARGRNRAAIERQIVSHKNGVKVRTLAIESIRKIQSLPTEIGIMKFWLEFLKFTAYCHINELVAFIRSGQVWKPLFDHEQNLAKTITHLFMDYAVTIKQNQSLKKPFCCNKSAIIEWD